ncbi:uncharacterized protein [Salminus brasiliensis]|uniref:uncharacterized protein n=1 Tax=Salminus brasiliensis TaxID=930266 RepID=UPI003B82CB2D
MLDCQASDDALLELFPALRYIRLSLGKRQLLQLMLLTQSVGERDSWSKAKALSRALGKEIDLSYTPLYFFTCVALGLVLQHSEDLTHLNLSHCQLTDSCLDLLLPHLHKVQLLDLSNNDITDAGAQRLQMILAREQTVHIFNNQITDLRLFMNRQSSPETYHNWPWTSYGCVDTEMKVSTGFAKRIATVAMFDPEIFFHDDKIIYRFDCEIAGEFQCKATGLIFGMRGRGCVEYKVVHWNMCYFSKNSYEPAGPLYNIQTSIGEMHLLHLPHCETEADVVGDISVAHIHEGTMELLTPVKRTSSHVTVHINGLSNFATVRKKGSMTRYVRGQVLLFLEPINRIEQRLWVFLLPRNVSATEIKKQHHEYTSIKTSSDCILRQKGKYCLSSSLKKYKVQPKTYSFHDATDPDYHSAFELFFSSEVSELRVRIHEKRNKLKTRWNRRVILNSNENHASTVKEEGGTYTKGNSLLTEQNWKSSLCDLLEELSKRDLKKLRFYMKDVTDFKPIPYGKLEKKDRQELVDLMVEAWGFQTSVQATDYFMKKLPRNDHAVTSILKPYQIQFGLIKESRVH